MSLLIHKYINNEFNYLSGDKTDDELDRAIKKLLRRFKYSDEVIEQELTRLSKGKVDYANAMFCGPPPRDPCERKF